MISSKQRGNALIPVLIVAGLVAVSGYIIYSIRLRITNSSKHPVVEQVSNSTVDVVDGTFKKPQPPYRLFITGDIDKNRKNVTLDPFFFVTSSQNNSNKKESTDKAQYTVTLKRKGIVVASKPLDATRCLVIQDYCADYDHSYGNFITLFEGVMEMPDELSITYKNVEILNRKAKENSLSTLIIKKQEYKDGTINVTWDNRDSDVIYQYQALVTNNNFSQKDSPDYVLKTITLMERYNVNEGGIPIFKGDSFTYKHTGFIEGDLQVALYATDSFNSYVWYSDVFKSVKNKVVAKIELPEEGKEYDGTLYLRSFSIDPRSGLSCGGCEKEGNSFQWTSDRDGVISNTPDALCQYLTSGIHKITLNVKNANGTESTTSVTVKVLPLDSQLDTLITEKRERKEFCYSI